MRILAVDTALGACSCAVLDGPAVRAHRFVPMERGHAEALAPMVEAAMHEAHTGFQELDRLAVTIGPGTFTGQRVGLAFMRGLRVALKIPLTGVTTLEAMAAAAMKDAGTGRAAVLHDAKRGEVYYAFVSGRQTIIPAAIASLEEACAAIRTQAADGQPFAVCGTALAAAMPLLGSGGVPTAIRAPDALYVAQIAMARPASNEAPKPLYLRPPDARLPAAVT